MSSAPLLAVDAPSLLYRAFFALPVETIGSRFGGIPQSLPRLELPPFSWASAQQLVIPTLTIALLGAIESLLCARIADNLTDLPRHDPNQELMAQGIANVVAPLFGGFAATAWLNGVQAPAEAAPPLRPPSWAAGWPGPGR